MGSNDLASEVRDVCVSHTIPQGQKFQIHPTPSEPHSNAYVKFAEYHKYIVDAMKLSIGDDDYVFPFFGFAHQGEGRSWSKVKVRMDKEMVIVK
jgi:hypothetical protein